VSDPSKPDLMRCEPMKNAIVQYQSLARKPLGELRAGAAPK
jgi:hypothetical protein